MGAAITSNCTTSSSISTTALERNGEIVLVLFTIARSLPIDGIVESNNGDCGMGDKTVMDDDDDDECVGC